MLIAMSLRLRLPRASYAVLSQRVFTKLKLFYGDFENRMVSFLILRSQLLFIFIEVV